MFWLKNYIIPVKDTFDKGLEILLEKSYNERWLRA